MRGQTPRAGREHWESRQQGLRARTSPRISPLSVTAGANHCTSGQQWRRCVSGLQKHSPSRVLRRSTGPRPAARERAAGAHRSESGQQEHSTPRVTPDLEAALWERATGSRHSERGQQMHCQWAAGQRSGTWQPGRHSGAGLRGYRTVATRSRACVAVAESRGSGMIRSGVLFAWTRAVG